MRAVARVFRWFGIALGLLIGGLGAAVVVEELAGGVVEDVFELVHQAEALPNDGLVCVESDDPVSAVPMRGAGNGQSALTDDADPWCPASRILAVGLVSGSS